jgi:phenylpropionate dioxygenase-like ring-hydroxylating dioxygenase large terminal subunit
VFAHRDTIGPHFQRNLAITDQFGPHFRVIMPTRAMETVAELPGEQQHLRDFSHILFSLMPTDSLLVQKAHIDWIKFRPVAVDETEISITSLIPDDPSGLSADSARHWQRNLDITNEVLAEDFSLAEGIQRSLASGALRDLNYGCNEWALSAFNKSLDAYCESAPDPAG